MPFITVGAGSSSGGGSLVVPNELRFDVVKSRDDYFVAHPDKLKDELIVLVGSAGKEQLFQYRVQTTSWVDITAVVVGAKGERGIAIMTQYSDDGNTGWTDKYSQAAEFMRFSNDEGVTWTEPARFRSEQVVYQYSVDGTTWESLFSNEHKFARLSIDSGEHYTDSFKIAADSVLFQYAETELGPWVKQFDRVNTPWCRVSIDGGRTFELPFRIVAQDGLSFTVQYSASALGPWTSFFNDGVHEFFRFSNDNGTTWTPAQRFKAVPFGVNSEDRNIIDIGGHKIISNNENIAFHNIFTGDNFYPVWQGISNDGHSIYRASEVIFGDRVDGFSLNGNKTDAVVNYDFTKAYSMRMAIFGMEFVPAEDYLGDIKFQIWSQGGITLIYSQTIRNAELVNGKAFPISYKGNLFVQPGNILNVRVVKGGDGSPIKAYAGSTTTTEPWRRLNYVPMEAVQLINKNDGKDVARMLEGLTDTDRLSINALKDVGDLKTGSFRGPIDFAKGVSQFVPATKNDYWRSDREISYQGVSFKIGDKLIIMRNIAADEVFANIVDQSVFYLERNLANVAKPNEVGTVKPGYNTQVSASGELTVKPASAIQEGAVKLGIAGGAARLGEDGKISTEQLPPIDTVRRVTVANESARLSLPPSNRFTIAIQLDNQNQYYLDPNMLASFKGNWIPAGSVAAAVLSFKDRTGHVEPQAGDYTAEMVKAVPIPTDDGKRRVLIGASLVEEKKTEELITDPITSIQYKLMVVGGVPVLRPTNTEDV